MLICNEDLIKINGGSGTVTAAMINAIARGVTVLYSLGRAFGSAVRYAFGKKYC